MTFQEFQPGMQRLTKTWERVYSEERVRIIFEAVRDLNSSWWSKTVDGFIGYSRQAPLMPEIMERVSEERERLREIQKRQESADSKHAMQSLYSNEDIKSICKQIRERIEGRMGDQDFGSFSKLIGAGKREGR